MKNIFSVDLEDWFCVNSFDDKFTTSDWESLDLRVRYGTRIILRLLKKHNVKATFFVLGYIADRDPKLISEINKNGHEIASHGYYHRPVSKLTSKEYIDDLRRSILSIKKACGVVPLGYRAPSFSLNDSKRRSVFRLLKSKGFRYDSSSYPTSYHPNYGTKDKRLGPYSISRNFMEFPLSCIKIFTINFPFSGGAYFRFLPYSIIKLFIRRINKLGRPYVFYIHPWELDIKQPVVKTGFFNKLRHYGNIAKTEQKLDKLLTDFEFTSINKIFPNV